MLRDPQIEPSARHGAALQTTEPSVRESLTAKIHFSHPLFVLATPPIRIADSPGYHGAGSRVIPIPNCGQSWSAWAGIQSPEWVRFAARKPLILK
jgi:hypothetical protein